MIVNKNLENYTFQDTLDDQLLEGNINLNTNGSFDMNFRVGQYGYVSYGKDFEGNYFLNVTCSKDISLMSKLRHIINTVLIETGIGSTWEEEESYTEQPKSQDQ